MPPNTPTTRTLASTSLWLIGSFSGLLFLQQHVLNGLASIWRHFFQQPLLLVWLNQIVFLPGVWLHESSHWLFAKLLGVPTFDFSLLPQQLPDGSIRMGYVTVAQTDPLRAALVGAAPLFGGVLAVWAIGNWRFNLAAVGQALLAGAFRQAWQLARLPRWDTLLWAYLLFAISNTMLPSAADQRAWPVVLVLLVVVVIGLLALRWGKTAWNVVGHGLQRLALLLASTFTVTCAVNLVAWAVTSGVLWFLAR